ncbi:hypothetical protein HBB16_17490 [Pseudonocardia sp. MCCB 268]|nr:hypothetical protein [Pseudonocardia cytotoxica]
MRLTEMHSLAGADTTDVLPDYADVGSTLDRRWRPRNWREPWRQVVDATPPQPSHAAELKVEISVLDSLVHQARQVRHAGDDRKWNERVNSSSTKSDVRRRRSPTQDPHLH